MTALVVWASVGVWLASKDQSTDRLNGPPSKVGGETPVKVEDWRRRDDQDEDKDEDEDEAERERKDKALLAERLGLAVGVGVGAGARRGMSDILGSSGGAGDETATTTNTEEGGETTETGTETGTETLDEEGEVEGGFVLASAAAPGRGAGDVKIEDEDDAPDTATVGGVSLYSFSFRSHSVPLRVECERYANLVLLFPLFPLSRFTS